MKFFIGLFMFMCACIVGLGALEGFGSLDVPEPAGHYEVEAGQTLWEVALCLDYPDDVKLRRVIRWLEDNSGTGADIQEGQVIPVPFDIREGSSCQKVKR